MKKYSLHIGINEADPAHYDTFMVPLESCENDARALHASANWLHFTETELLLGEDATAVVVKEKLQNYASQLESGDFLLISYSGHGGNLPDLSEDEEEGTDFDQTWCLYDRQLLDDELGYIWPQFNAGVKIFLLLDACHSGTAARKQMLSKDPLLLKLEKLIDKFLEDEGVPEKSLPAFAGEELYFMHQDLYDKIIGSHMGPFPEIKASLKQFSACQDDQKARAGSTYSYFTLALIQVMERYSRGIATYSQLFTQLMKQAMPSQMPNEMNLGSQDEYFEKSAPFLAQGESYPADAHRFFRNLRKADFT